MASSIDIAAK